MLGLLRMFQPSVLFLDYFFFRYCCHGWAIRACSSSHRPAALIRGAYTTIAPRDFPADERWQSACSCKRKIQTLIVADTLRDAWRGLLASQFLLLNLSFGVLTGYWGETETVGDYRGEIITASDEQQFKFRKPIMIYLLLSIN